MNEEQIEAMRAYLDDPPDHARQVCFMYRQSIGSRQQAEARLAKARKAIAEAQQAAQQAQVELHTAIGVERGFHDSVVALMNPNPGGEDGKVHHLPTADGGGE